MNRVREKVKPQRKISYKVFKEEDGCDKFRGISPFPTIIQLKDFLGGNHHCVTVVGNNYILVLLDLIKYYEITLVLYNTK